MGGIILKRENVVKHVDSEDKARDLEAKGFCRTDGKAVPAGPEMEIGQLKESLVRAGEAIKAADARKGELEKELSDTKGQLTEAEGRIRDLETELSGIREQLEAAVKKNKETTIKKEK